MEKSKCVSRPLQCLVEEKQHVQKQNTEWENINCKKLSLDVSPLLSVCSDLISCDLFSTENHKPEIKLEVSLILT